MRTDRRVIPTGLLVLTVVIQYLGYTHLVTLGVPRPRADQLNRVEADAGQDMALLIVNKANKTATPFTKSLEQMRLEECVCPHGILLLVQEFGAVPKTI